MKERKSEKQLNNYDCGYCGHKFKQYVGFHNAENEHGHGKHENGSDQVKCTRCGNFLKTWE